MRMKTFTKTKTNFVVANIQRMQNFITANKKVTSTMKDETRSVRTVELVGLKSKMY